MMCGRGWLSTAPPCPAPATGAALAMTHRAGPAEPAGHFAVTRLRAPGFPACSIGTWAVSRILRIG